MCFSFIVMHKNDQTRHEIKKANLLGLNDVLDVIAVTGHHLLVLLGQGCVVAATDAEQRSVSLHNHD